MLKPLLLLLFVSYSLVNNVTEARARIGVASNFTHTAKLLVQAYVLKGNREPVLIFGSTGKHAAQIRSGLPIDLLLAADRQTPMELIAESFGVYESLETYAFGNLMFWFDSDFNSNDNLEELFSQVCGAELSIAIANPRFAPYGVASKEVVASLFENRMCKAQLVFGENVAQAAHFANSGAVSAAFLPQALAPYMKHGDSIKIPNELHSPIEQKMLMLTDNMEAKSFYQFILSEEGKSIIRSNGYGLKND